MKNKKRVKEALSEILLELIIVIVCLGIGIIILTLFGVDITSPEIDYELIALLGSVVIISIFVAAYFIIQGIKKATAVTHEMKLMPSPFEMIKAGQKTIELRLLDEKREQIKIGDKIIFTSSESGETVKTKVLNLHKFASFEELYKSLPLLKCGYTEQNVAKASHTDMEEYYSKEKQQKYGVVGIELCIER